MLSVKNERAIRFSVSGRFQRRSGRSTSINGLLYLPVVSIPWNR
jgi:hypothetical protein